MMQVTNMPMWIMPIILVAVVWTLFWKVLSLWHAAKKGKKGWFILLLLVNSLGVLDVFYLFYVEKIKAKKLFK